MDGKIGRLDKYVGPNPSHQFLLTDQLTLKQNNQDLQSTTCEGYWLVVFQEKKLCREQPKWFEAREPGYAAEVKRRIKLR